MNAWPSGTYRRDRTNSEARPEGMRQMPKMSKESAAHVDEFGYSPVTPSICSRRMSAWPL